MQLVIRIQLDEPLVLTPGYRTMVRGALYDLLKEQNKGFSKYIHGNAFEYEKRPFKLFTFTDFYAPPDSKPQNKGNKVIFENEVCFEVRSIEPYFIYAIKKQIVENGLHFGSKGKKHHYSCVEVACNDVTVETDDILISTLSPICVYRTFREKKQCYAPNTDEFYELLRDNFRRKYTACYGVQPDSDIDITLCGDIECVEVKDGGDILTAWYGGFRLRGKRKYIDFLYQTGLGTKNPIGLGAFVVVDENELSGRLAKDGEQDD